MKLNDAQRQAVSFLNGPALVLAGPGSGKTAVITERVASLIRDHGVAAENILVLTFTRAAAAEMRGRAHLLAGDAVSAVTFGTFHSVFYSILKKELDLDMRNIITQEQKTKLLRDICALIRREADDDTTEELSGIISAMRRSGASYRADPGIFDEKERRFIYDVYIGYLRRYGLYDYDDMAERTEELFLKDSACLEGWREKYKYILIDEFQDIDRRQYELVRLLAYPENNLFAVGDDDQSIYGFRGSTPGVMKSFAKDYKRALRVILNTNYRSTPQIVRVSQTLIRQNRSRFEKALTTVNRDGENVRILRCVNDTEELRVLTLSVKKRLASGDIPGETAVLVRTRLQENAVRRSLEEAGISASDGVPGSVRVMTMHRAKGLEFDTVFIIGAVEGTAPHRRAVSVPDTEEERRLFYVAMTRARKHLVISYAAEIRGKQTRRSRFLDEISPC